MIDDDEVWCYDVPHESGGNCHVTMTVRQAIDFMRETYPGWYDDKPDDGVFDLWVVNSWAYREVRQ